MLKSKTIADFLEAKVAEIRPDEPLPVDLHLYFRSNAHIMLWRPAGSVLTKDQLDSYRSRGLEIVWIHQSEWHIFDKYLHPALELPIQDDMVLLTGSPPEAESEVKIKAMEGPILEYSRIENLPPLSQELVYTSKVTAKRIFDLIRDDKMNEREKRALIAKSARELLGNLATPTNTDKQDPVSAVIAGIIRDFLSELAFEARALARQIWAIAAIEPELNHAVNVATISVLFAMAFGKIDEALLSDVALAGLLHDIGMTQLPYQLAQIPWESVTPEQIPDFLQHSSFTAELITEFAPEISDRVKAMIQAHHAKYADNKIVSPVRDMAQLVAMADRVDSLCNGLWDGQERTVMESLLILEAQENQAGEYRQFNGEVFAAVLRWIRGRIPDHSLQTAMASVGDRLRAAHANAS